MGLWTFADDAGVFEWHDKLLKSQIFPFDDGVKVEKLIEELMKQNRIVSFYHNKRKYGLVLNFTKYQKPDSRYIKYTIGDYEHVMNVIHGESTPCARGAPYTEGVSEGVSVSDVEGEIAMIEEVASFPQQEMAYVMYQDRTILIPLNDEFILDVDKENKKVTMSLPNGILSL
jgi:hypothetical protein